jgi:hypothetical protein
MTRKFMGKERKCMFWSINIVFDVSIFMVNSLLITKDEWYRQ